MAEERPKDTTELLARIESEWQLLMQLVDRLTPEQMITPDSGGWSPKDNLAHLASWMKYMKRSHVHKMPGYEAMEIDPEKWKQLDENGINAVLLERNRPLSTAQVLDTLKSTYADVVADLRSVPFDDLLQRTRPENPDSGYVIDFVLGNTSDHFLEHRTNIEKGL